MHRFLRPIIASMAVSLLLTPVTSAQDTKVETAIRPDQKDAFGDPLPRGAIARIGTTRYRLSASHLPHSATLSPDGKLLLILRLPDEIEIWELPAWRLHRVIKCQKLNEDSQLVDRNGVFSADSKKLVMFDGALQQVQFFDVDSGKLVKQIDLSKVRTKSDDFPRLKLSNDQQTLIITNNIIGPVGRDQIGVWDLAKNKMVHSFYVMKSRVDQGVVISADCRWMAQHTAEYAPSHLQEDGTYAVRVFDLLAGKSIRSIDTEFPMEKLIFSPDGKWLATSHGSHLRIFDDAGKERHNIRMKTSMLPMEFSPDGKFLYLADYTGNVQKWNLISGERMASYPAPYRCAITQLSFQPEGKVMALGISAFAIHYWDITAGKSIAPTGVPASVISDLTFLSHGELLVVSEEGMIAAWNPRTGAKLRDLKLDSLRSDNFADHQYYGISIDGKYHRRDGVSFTFSRRGDFLANYNHLHDLKTGKLLWPGQSDFPFGPVQEAGAMIFLNAGSNIASLLQKKVRIWNIFTGRDVMNFDLTLRNKEKVVMLRASSNGRYFAFGTLNNTKRSNYTGTVTGDLGVRLWDAIEKKFVREWPLPKYLEWMEFSPDNQWLAFAGENSRVHLARVGFADQDFELHLGENTKKVTQITFSPDGRQLACAAIVPIRDQDASRIFIYELASKKIRLKLVDDPTGIIERLAYSGDSGLLASGGTDTTALVWNTGLRTFAAKPAGKVATLGELADWYHEMAGANAETAYQNMIKLAQTPKQAIRFFADKIPPTTKPGTDENTMLHARAVEVLEAIATPEAHALLTRWSAGDPTAVLTRESRKALAALKQ